jgi:putative aldouronate transport system permease protein
MAVSAVSEKRGAARAPVGGAGRALRKIWSDRYIYALLLPGALFFAVFSYVPMYGVTLAFKKYMANLGILGSPWIGLQNFEKLMRLPDFWRSLRNTLIISGQRLVFEFPIPICLALMLNELRRSAGKRIMQTIFTFPYFLSWIVVFGLVFNIFADNGLVNFILVSLGFEKTNLLSSPPFFRPLLYITSNWKGMGWSAIIYLASITSVDPQLYESAVLDGATRWKQTWHITLPGIRSAIAIMLILAIGNIMNAGFDQIFNMYNPAVYEVADILDTYIYRRAFMTGSDFGQSTAVTLFKAVINFSLLFGADRAAKLIGEEGIY